MKKKSVVIISLMMLLSMVSIAILFALSNKDIRYSQNFVRIVNNFKLTKKSEVLLHDANTYLAGIDDDHIYVANMTNPRSLQVYDKDLGQPLKQITIVLDGVDTIRFNKAKILIDSPFFYIEDGQKPAIYRGLIHNWVAYEFVKELNYFSQALPIQQDKMVVMSTASFGNEEMKNILGVVQPKCQAIYKSYDNSKDANFYNTKAIITYSKVLNQIILTHLYSNIILGLDTSLNIVMQYHTIDTISKMKAKQISASNNNLTVASPSSLVNINTCVFKELLFVQSNLMGNESRAIFDNSSVIDIYHLRFKQYLSSIYVPNKNSSEIKKFFISENSVVAEYGNSLVVFEIDSLSKLNEN